MRASEEEEWSEWALSGKAPAGIRLVDSTERESDSKNLEVCWFYSEIGNRVIVIVFSITITITITLIVCNCNSVRFFE